MSGPILEARAVSKRFGGVVALDTVSLSIEAGSRHVIIGPNGSGKSTLINVFSGVYAPEQGEVFFQGEKITGLPAYAVTAKGIARTFQNVRPFTSMTVWENIAVGVHCRTRYGLFEAILHCGREPAERKKIDAKVTELAEFFGLRDLLAEKVQSLPYGKQRIVEIARALASQANLLLLDEPAAGMNAAEAQALAATIRKITGLGATVALIEHNMEFVKEIADTITVLDSGEKIAEGSFAAVQSNKRVVEAYLGKRVAANA